MLDHSHWVSMVDVLPGLAEHWLSMERGSSMGFGSWVASWSGRSLAVYGFFYGFYGLVYGAMTHAIGYRSLGLSPGLHDWVDGSISG